MDAYRTEEEQLEALKRWWSDNGKGIVAAVVIGVLGSIGWQAWQDRQVAKAESASAIYQELLGLGAQASTDRAQKVRLDELVATLSEDYAGTGYADLGQLLQAAAWVADGRSQEALTLLTALEARVVDDPAMYPVVKLRRARLQAALGDTDQALAALASLENTAVAAAAWLAQADIFIVGEQYVSAAQALTLALAADQNGDLGADLETKLAFVNARINAETSPLESGE